MFRKIQKLHFVGIGGIGMSGIAELLLNLGYEVSGSDAERSPHHRPPRVPRRDRFRGARAANVEKADVVVVSSAVRPDNLEVVEAKRRQIPVIPRAEMLAELMRLKYSIAVAGAHGKTTTTSMIATVLVHGGYDPTAVIGGRLNAFGSNAKLGRGDFLVAEADESDGSFLKLSPTIAVVTNIDREHLDHYADLEEIQSAFVTFVNKVPFYGAAVLCLDDPNRPGDAPQDGAADRVLRHEQSGGPVRVARRVPGLRHVVRGALSRQSARHDPAAGSRPARRPELARRRRHRTGTRHSVRKDRSGPGGIPERGPPIPDQRGEGRRSGRRRLRPPSRGDRGDPERGPGRL